MFSSRIEQVFYNAHSKVSHYVLRHTSHRLRSAIEHAALGLAVCGFCVVILSHRTFVHREEREHVVALSLFVPSAARGGGIVVVDGGGGAGGFGNETAWCATESDVGADGGHGTEGETGRGDSSSGDDGFLGEGRGVSMYSIVASLARAGHARAISSERRSGDEIFSSSSSSWSEGKKIPGHCLRSIPGFREDADVNHMLVRYDEDRTSREDDEDEIRSNDAVQSKSPGSRAFTIHRGAQGHTAIVSGMPTNSTQQSHSCIIGAPAETTGQRKKSLFGRGKDRQNLGECSPEISNFLARHGYFPGQFDESSDLSKQYQTQSVVKQHRQYSAIIYSYSHSQGFLRLQPSLQHAHNISTQFIIASSTDLNCFGDPIAQSIIFRLVGPDTVILNWILGLQHHTDATTRPRFVHYWKTRKDLDLDVFDMDHYAFSSKSKGDDHRSGIVGGARSGPASASFAWTNRVLARVQKYPVYHFLRFLTFKCLVLLSTLLIFFLTTSLVSFTFQETQDRMLEFTLQLQTRVRARMPLGGLILGHVLENLVFVPIMVGMIFFLIEFYEDRFLAFMVLSMVWVCEVFSAISIRSAQGMHFFPRVFFLYFTLFHVYFFSCPIGFTYASLASTVLFLFHTMLFFWNRYELPALHAGLITPQSPRMARLGEDTGREPGEVNDGVASPPRIQPASTVPSRQAQPPQLPPISSLDDRSTYTLPTAPLSSTFDFTPQSDQSTLLPPPYPSSMRSYIAAASTSLQSIRSLASIQSSTSLAAERTTSPNFIFQGGYGFNDSEGAGDGEEDSYIARVMSSR